jgi:hypothetical protein
MMVSLKIAPPKPLSGELNTEGVIDLGFHSGGANKREAFIYRGFSYIATNDELQWQLTHVNIGRGNMP